MSVSALAQPSPSGPDTWFLLRGLSREAGHWGTFVPDLRAALPGARVHPLDLPGAGTRRDVDWPESVTAAMERVRTDAEAVAPRAARGRTFVFALSLGGMVALEWATQHPDELAGIAVGNTSAGGVSPFWRRAQPNAWPRMLAATMRREGIARELGILAMVSNRRDLHAETAASWTFLARTRPMQRKNVVAQLRAAASWQVPLARPAVPLLVLCGLGDRMVHPSCSRFLAHRWGARLAEHPSAGHELTLDAGDWTAAQLARFADRLR